MLPQLDIPNSVLPLYSNFFQDLINSSFTGEIKTSFADRLIMATDNSIYQILPQGVIFPKTADDLALFFKLLTQSKYQEIKIVPRGGGTGTNGQSLNKGIVVDLSRHMNRILELNLKEGWVKVQAGVVRDQLNDFLKPHGYFFAPTLSTSNRATLGGMINTDACGKGSRIYGKTSNHVLELKSILADGTILQTKELELEALEKYKTQPGREGHLYSLVDSIVSDKQEQIKTQIPHLPRFLTGYNLEKIYSEDRLTFNLNYLLTGSEGTLAVVTEAKLKITPEVRHKKLLLVKYSSFDDALQDAQLLLKFNPSAIETIDDKILNLAKEDEIYHQVKEMIANKGQTVTRALNLVEFSGDNLEALNQRVEPLAVKIQTGSEQITTAIGCYSTSLESEMDAMWELRKKGVGLLGNTKGERKPIAFVEDTAVPPQHLAEYIREFRALLEENGLEYGMFGHVDVGCLHVRPALDLKKTEDEALLIHISNQVVALVQKYGGVMWGEHGKGFRSEYIPEFFGEELYHELRRIKGEFDPLNRLNPGKIVTPLDTNYPVAGVKSHTKGEEDRQINRSLQHSFASALNCNGNGACFNYHPDDLMCPSMRVTRDRIHSPKGRAGVIREWVKQLSLKGFSLDNFTPAHEPSSFLSGLYKKFVIKKSSLSKQDFSHQVYAALNGCLACKACATQCPVKVDVPEFKTKFLTLYHTRYLRPLKDYLTVNLERYLPSQAYFPKAFNRITNFSWIKELLKNMVGIVDIPRLSELSVVKGLKKRSAPVWDLEKLADLSEAERRNSAILVQDSFTSFYEAELVLQLYDLLRLMGVQLYVMPIFQNGKAYHIKGFLTKFGEIAQQNSKKLNAIAKLKIPLIGIDPAVVLTYRMEYPGSVGVKNIHFKVQQIQEWLIDFIRDNPLKIKTKSSQSITKKEYQLFGHCTEKAVSLSSQEQWVAVFQSFGLKLNPEQVGCCGMCGIYGHEKVHLQDSLNIYKMSWQKKIKNNPNALVTGYSCRSQVKRIDGFKPDHPLTILLKSLQ
jgi:FAD/FMN-containing dehydrogenase/Fe-S oxidoreductase